MRRQIATVLRRVAGDRLLLVLCLACPVLLWLVPVTLRDLPTLVDWKTISALAGLMVLSRALEVSGLLDRLGHWLLSRLHSLRALAVALVLFAAALSAVITNDVALFVTVPLTLGLARVVALPVARLVIFQALAVNAGSALSPVGNPQNLFLWSVSGAGFWEFTAAMLPIATVMLVTVLALVPLAFDTSPLVLPQTQSKLPLQRRLIWGALIAYPLFLGALASGIALAAAAMLVAAYAAFARPVLKGVDWALLLIFVLMFVNLGLLGRIPALAAQVDGLMQGELSILAMAALVSQILSNVPAAIFLAQFTENWSALAWGVNVGGYGLAIGSLANLIAMRLAPLPGIWRDFHLWSVTLFLISGSAAIGLMLLF